MSTLTDSSLRKPGPNCPLHGGQASGLCGGQLRLQAYKRTHIPQFECEIKIDLLESVDPEATKAIPRPRKPHPSPAADLVTLVQPYHRTGSAAFINNCWPTPTYLTALLRKARATALGQQPDP
ncbi:hypothetical protein SNOG_03005 [Parastagonospora nodorum SN15]|uniref:Uncharacterized protein n=1 Tax=Phaeosphaeria nodorum (strain SN15 / ATCC MYA-4574 / FGSC 10173) TaxID=321614 RepID=Q0UZ09_PHANO|nr:hypothetical protein SNOG_03005 [Parastagonospora nodorum SN15]EAT89736.1 hypothetical protein SNOG_03005 [Parastagonospora nodorum SN15]